MEPEINDSNKNFKLKGPKGWAHNLKNGIKGTFKNATNVLGAGKKKMFTKVIFVVATVAKIVLPVILVFAVLTHIVSTDPQEKLTSTIDSYISSSTTMSQEAKTAFNETGSLLLATNDDIKQMSKDYLESIATKHNLLYEAMSEEDKIGNHKLSSIDYAKDFDINSAYEFILNAERMNFNRVSWKKVNRENGEISDLELQKDDTTKLKYPKNDEEKDTSKDLTYFVNLLMPFMQSYVVPGTMLSGVAALKTNDDVGNYAFQIIDKGYHPVDVLQYTMQTAMRNQEKRHYIESTAEVEVYTKKETRTRRECDDEGKNCKMVDYTVTLHAYSKSDLDNGYDKAKRIYGDALKTNSELTSVLSSSAKEIDKTFSYPIVKAETLDKFVRVEYEQKKYSDSDVENFEHEDSKYITNTKEFKENSSIQGSAISSSGGWTSQGKTTVTIKYGEDITTQYIWEDKLEEKYNEERNYEVDDVSEFVNNIDNIIVVPQRELTEEEQQPGNRPDLRLKADDLFSAYEINYYKELAEDKKLTRVDLVNAVPSVIKNYLTDSEKDSQHIGYHRSKLSSSYNMLYKYITDKNSNEKISTSVKYGIGITGQDVDYSNLPSTSFGWPFPTNRVVSALQGYSGWYNASHRGIDIWAVDENGKPSASLQYVGKYDVVAARAGTVIDVYDNTNCRDTTNVNDGCGGGWGNHVIIKHTDGYYTVYAHMTAGTIGVVRGQKVEAGKYLGKVGSSGPSSGAHLHFEVLNGGLADKNCLDPLYWFYVEPYNYNVPYSQKDRRAITMENPYKVSERIKTETSSNSDHDEIDRKIDDMDDVELLARLIYSEQGANSEESRVLVGISVLNRAKNSSIKTVAKSKYKGTNGKTFYQYNGVENANFWGNIPDYSMEDAGKAMDIVNNKGTYKVNGVECINVEGFKASNDKSSLSETWNKWSRKVILENTKSGAKYTGYYGI